MSSPKQNPQEWIEIARFVGAQGIRGEMRLKSFTEIALDCLKYGDLVFEDGAPAHRLKVKAERKGSLIVSLPDVTNRNQAERLKGQSLYLLAENLYLDEGEDDSFFARDLEGLEVRLLDGTSYGQVKALLDYGAGEFLELVKQDKKLEHASFTHANFPTINLNEGWIIFVPPNEVVSQDDEGKVH